MKTKLFFITIFLLTLNNLVNAQIQLKATVEYFYIGNVQNQDHNKSCDHISNNQDGEWRIILTPLGTTGGSLDAEQGPHIRQCNGGYIHAYQFVGGPISKIWTYNGYDTFPVYLRMYFRGKETQTTGGTRSITENIKLDFPVNTPQTFTYSIYNDLDNPSEKWYEVKIKLEIILPGNINFDIDPNNPGGGICDDEDVDLNPSQTLPKGFEYAWEYGTNGTYITKYNVVSAFPVPCQYDALGEPIRGYCPDGQEYLLGCEACQSYQIPVFTWQTIGFSRDKLSINPSSQLPLTYPNFPIVPTQSVAFRYKIMRRTDNYIDDGDDNPTYGYPFEGDIKAVNFYKAFPNIITINNRTNWVNTGEQQIATLEGYSSNYGVFVTDPSCPGGIDGKIRVRAPDGMNFKLSLATDDVVNGFPTGPVDNSNIFSGEYAFINKGEGTYTLVIQSSTQNQDGTWQNGCYKSIALNLYDPPELNITVEPQKYIAYSNGIANDLFNIKRKGGEDPVNINTTGGIPGSKLFYVDGIAFPSGTRLGKKSTPYLFEGKHGINHACNAEESVSISLVEPDEFKADTISTKHSYCHGAMDGEIVFKIEGGIKPYNIQFISQSGNNDRIIWGLDDEYEPSSDTTLFKLPINGGDTYKIIIGDTVSHLVEADADYYDYDKAYKVIENVLITEPIAYSFPVFNTTEPWCIGDASGKLEVSIEGGFYGDAPSQYTCIIEEDNSSGNPGVLPSDLNYKVERTLDAGITTTFDGLQAGDYLLRISLANDAVYPKCELIKPFIITQPQTIDYTYTYQNIGCKGDNDGEIYLEITPSTGRQPYIVELVDKWDKRVKIDTLKEEPEEPYNKYNFTGLIPDEYKVKVYYKDCAQFPTAITKSGIKIQEPTEKLEFVSLVPDSVACFGESNGKLKVEVKGGWGNYEYLIKKPDGSISSGSFDDVGNGITTITNLSAGTYTLYVKAINPAVPNIKTSAFCQITQEFTIKEPLPLQIDPNPIIENVSCNGQADGKVTLKITGGNPTAFYNQDVQVYRVLVNGNPRKVDFRSWDNTQTATIEGLKAGNYSFEVISQKGCNTSINDVIITQPAALVLTTNKKDPDCGERNGNASVVVGGGNPPYQYTWTKSDFTVIGTTNQANALDNGSYSIKVTDGEGCSISKSVFLSGAQAAQVSEVNKVSPTCAENNDAYAELKITGDFPITVEWLGEENGRSKNLSGNTLTLGNLSKGYHYLKLTDNKACIRYYDLYIEGPEPLSISTITEKSPNCTGNADGELEIAVMGGTGPYSIIWDNGQEGNKIDNLSAGTYSVNITDAQACTITQGFYLQDPLPFRVDLGGNAIICANTIYQLDAGPGIAYQWKDEDDSLISEERNILLNQAGKYKVEVISSRGCIANDEFELMLSDNLLAADFLMPDTAFVGDTVILIDITKPLPNFILWDFGQGNPLKNEPTDFQQEIVFYEEGRHKIRLQVATGDCQDDLTRDILIINPNQDLSMGEASPTPDIIQEAILYPNPNQGEFSLRVELSIPSPIEVEVIEPMRQQVILKKQSKRNWQHQMSFDLQNYAQGTYLINIKAENSIKTIRVVIY